MRAYSAHSAGLLRLLAASVANLFKSRRRLEAEDLFLRHQLNIASRRRAPRLRLRGSDRALLVWRTRLWPSLLGMARVVEAATILGWYRALGVFKIDIPALTLRSLKQRSI